MNPLKTEECKEVAAIYETAATGYPEAAQFLHAWHLYCHEIDDFIDNKVRDPEAFLTMLAHANIVYSMPFYTHNARALQPVVVLITNAFADSVRWEGATDWRQRWGDVLRFAGIEMVMAVAGICGGWHRVRHVSEQLRKLAWDSHHNQDGTPD